MKTKTSRISVIIDKDLEDHLRERQANMIKKTKRNVSFSYVVNLVLKEGIKKKIA
jgi:hypothetical protein